MKKPFYKNLFFWLVFGMCVIVALIICAIYFARQSVGIIPFPVASGNDQDNLSDQLIESKDLGYSFHVPQDWYVEQNGSTTITIYPDYSPNTSSSATCKIEMAVFPYASTTEKETWIAQRLGADPTVSVQEQSSAEISFASGTGIKWTGALNDIPTTLIYAFNDFHAYEIAPSVIGMNSQGSGQCTESVDVFLKKLTL